MTDQSASRAARPQPAFELKGTISSLTVLRLRTTDPELIDRDLSARISQLPHFFLDAPVVLDLGQIEPGTPIAFAPLVKVLRARRLVPVAAKNLPPELQEQASAAGLGLLREGLSRMTDPSSADPERAEGSPRAASRPTARPEPREDTAGEAGPPGPPAAPLVAPATAMVIKQPVRAGQVIFAPAGDLIVLAPVNPGAEVIADGNVHVYAPLRGRALAGAHGNESARLFCSSLDAELISVAGNYFSAEDIPESLRRKPAQVYLDGDQLRVSEL